MSHELRTPLNAIIGFAEMLANVQLIPQAGEAARICVDHSAVRRASALGGELDPRHVENSVRHIRYQPERFCVAPLIDLCCDMVKLKAQNSGVELIRAYPKDLAQWSATSLPASRS